VGHSMLAGYVGHCQYSKCPSWATKTAYHGEMVGCQYIILGYSVILSVNSALVSGYASHGMHPSSLATVRAGDNRAIAHGACPRASVHCRARAHLDCTRYA
jgi:hypothetical protein